MKLFSFTFLLLFCMSFFASAQSNYKPGYVVSANGDTTKGYIDYREWNSNPNSISFKKALADKSLRYTPVDIASFGINGLDAYQTYSGAISTDEINIDRLATYKDTSVRQSQVFLKVLQKGKNVTLYSYTDDLKARYFISERQPKVTELVYHIYLADDASGARRTYTDNTYLKQLYSLASKYNVSSEGLINKADYQESTLLAAVSRINNISDREFKAKYNGKSDIYFYVGAGANMASFTLDQGTGYQRAGGKNSSSVLPVFDAGVNFFLNPNTESLAFRIEFAAALAKYKSVYDNQVSPMVNITYGFSTLDISVSPQVIYNFYHDKDLKIYLGGGAQITSVTGSSQKYIKTSDGSAVPTSANPFLFRKINVPVIVKAGMVLNNKFDINAGYVFSEAVSNDYVFLLNKSAFQLGVNYRL